MLLPQGIRQSPALTVITLEERDVRIQRRAHFLSQAHWVDEKESAEFLNGGFGFKGELASPLQPGFMHKPIPEVVVEAIRQAIAGETPKLFSHELLESLPHTIPEAEVGQSVDAGDKENASGEGVALPRALFRGLDVEAGHSPLELLGQIRPVQVNLFEGKSRREVQQVPDLQLSEAPVAPPL